MIKLCILVTGSTGSGKSTIVDRLAERGWTTAHTGEVVRRLVRDADVGAGAIAPAHLDDKVWSVVESVLCASTCRDVAIECMPRNEAQLHWIDDIRALGYIPVVVRAVAPLHVREARIRARDATNPTRLALDLRKMEAEGDDFGSSSYFTGLLHAVPHTIVNTGTRGDSMDMQPEMALLDSMMAMAVGVHDKRSGSGAVDLGRMMTRCKDEVHEALLAHDQFVLTGTPILHVREELIDAMFFLLVAMHGAGLTARGAFSLFAQKYRVNVHRADTGAKPHVKDLLR